MADGKTYCLFCSKVLKGRSDKLYCNDDCRNAYFNEKNKTEHKEIRVIDLALRKNRRILKKFFSRSKEKLVERDKMIGEGFDFNYHTHFVITKIQTNEFTFCFDYGYREVEKGKYKIIKSF